MPLTHTSRSGIRIQLYVIRRMGDEFTVAPITLDAQGISEVIEPVAVMPGLAGARMQCGFHGCTMMFRREANDDPSLVETWI